MLAGIKSWKNAFFPKQTMLDSVNARKNAFSNIIQMLNGANGGKNAFLPPRFIGLKPAGVDDTFQQMILSSS